MLKNRQGDPNWIAMLLCALAMLGLSAMAYGLAELFGLVIQAITGNERTDGLLDVGLFVLLYLAIVRYTKLFPTKDKTSLNGALLFNAIVLVAVFFLDLILAWLRT